MADSVRVRLARLAHDAALADPGVSALDAGPTGVRATRDGPELLPGVVSAAVAGGRYELDLHLVAVPEDLRATGERVRSAVATSAAQQGLGDQLASVSVRIEDVVAP